MLRWDYLTRNSLYQYDIILRIYNNNNGIWLVWDASRRDVKISPGMLTYIPCPHLDPPEGWVDRRWVWKGLQDPEWPWVSSFSQSPVSKYPQSITNSEIIFPPKINARPSPDPQIPGSVKSQSVKSQVVSLCTLDRLPTCSVGRSAHSYRQTGFL